MLPKGTGEDLGALPKGVELPKGYDGGIVFLPNGTGLAWDGVSSRLG